MRRRLWPVSWPWRWWFQPARCRPAQSSPDPGYTLWAQRRPVSFSMHQRHYGAVVWKRSGGDLDRKRHKQAGYVQDPHRAERTDLHAEGFLHGQRRDHKASPPSPKPVPKQPPAIRETKFLYRKDARLPEEEFQPIERKQLVRKLAELMRGLGLKYQRVLHLSWDIHLMFRRA